MNDKKEGKEKYYQEEGGKVYKETHYVNGKKEGKEISYYENGQIDLVIPRQNLKNTVSELIRLHSQNTKLKDELMSFSKIPLFARV